MGTQIFPNWSMDNYVLFDQDRHEIGGYVAIHLYGRASKLKHGVKGYITLENKNYNPDDLMSREFEYVDFRILHVYSPLTAKVKLLWG